MQNLQGVEFFRALWPHAIDELLILSGYRPNTKGTPPAQVLRVPIDFATPAFPELNPDLDWYFGVASRGNDLPPGKSGKKSFCLSAPGLFVDIDFATAGHSARNLPTEDQTAELLDEVGLEAPSLIVHSGGGWHCYWLFDKPAPANAEYERLVTNLQRRIRRTWEKHKLHLDDTAQIPRVLRVPGTTNWKTPEGRRCYVLDDNSACRYPLPTFVAPVGRPKKSSSKTGAGTAVNPTASSPRGGRVVSEEDFFGRLKELLLTKDERFKRVYAGERIADAEKDNTLQALTSAAAWTARLYSKEHATIENLLSIFEASMAAHVDEDWTLDENLAWAEDKIERALADVEEHCEAEAQQLDSIRRGFERAVAASTIVVDDPTNTFEKGDDHELASWFAKQGNPKVFDRGGLYTYEQCAWVEKTPAAWSREICETFKDRTSQKPGFNEKGNPYAAKEILLNNSKVVGIYKLLCAELDQPGFFDEAPYGYAFTNGFLRVNADEKSTIFVPHSPENRNIGVPFLEYVAHPEPLLDPWFEYVDGLHINIDAQNFMHEFIGVAMLGLAPRYKKCLSLLGAGDNGKSVFINFVASLFYLDRTSQLSPHRWGSRFGAGALKNSLLNYVEEIPTARIEATDVFKKVIGGSKMSTDVKNGAEFTFVPRAAHLFAFNELPTESSDLSDGWWTRWILVSFPRQFTAADKNPNQLAKIMPLASAVASYCLQQAGFVLESGKYNISEALESSVAAWRHKSDPSALFIETKLETCFENKLSTEEIYMSYATWCRNTHQVKPVSQEAFAGSLRKKYNVVDPNHSRWPIRIRTFSGISNVQIPTSYAPPTLVPPLEVPPLDSTVTPST